MKKLTWYIMAVGFLMFGLPTIAMQYADTKPIQVAPSCPQCYDFAWLKTQVKDFAVQVKDVASYAATKTNEFAHVVWGKLPESTRSQLKYAYDVTFHTTTGRITVATVAALALIYKLRK